MKPRNLRSRFFSPNQDSLRCRETHPLNGSSLPIDMVCRSLQRKADLFEKFCNHSGAKTGAKISRPSPVGAYAEVKKVLTQAIDELAPQEKILLSLYYCDDLNIREIGEVLGYSELKVSRLLKDGMKKVASKMQTKVDN